MSSHHGFNLHFFNFARAGVSFSCIYFNSTLSPFPLFMACVPAFSWRVLFLLIAGTLEQAVPWFLTRRQCVSKGVIFFLFYFCCSLCLHAGDCHFSESNFAVSSFMIFVSCLERLSSCQDSFSFLTFLLVLESHLNPESVTCRCFGDDVRAQCPSFLRP